MRRFCALREDQEFLDETEKRAWFLFEATQLTDICEIVMYGRPPLGKENLAALASGLERSCIRPVGAVG
jgi:hypothetical protein